MCLQHINVESECCDERSSKTSSFRRHDKIFDLCVMENAKRGQQQEQQRDDARKTHQVEAAQADAGQRSPPSEGSCSNEKAGNSKKYLHTTLAVPHEGGYQLLRNSVCVRHPGNKQAH